MSSGLPRHGEAHKQAHKRKPALLPCLLIGRARGRSNHYCEHYVGVRKMEAALSISNVRKYEQAYIVELGSRFLEPMGQISSMQKAATNQSSSFAVDKVAAMGFGSRPFGKMGFVHQKTSKIQNQGEETAAEEHMTDQTTPGIGCKPIQGAAVDYHCGESFQPQFKISDISSNLDTSNPNAKMLHIK
ncbi:hypothetical protein llap_7915 [Limosa lapponica baueri]|uniref:Uncharacterized protein n=1 Tax=Limosa lapponica baueri TaxID=1758121 RepID=A0A2I0U737_LIMLA|nr:hypothetical protein llap_7915 [Limosa lapponica baueri]